MLTRSISPNWTIILNYKFQNQTVKFWKPKTSRLFHFIAHTQIFLCTIRFSFLDITRHTFLSLIWYKKTQVWSTATTKQECYRTKERERERESVCLKERERERDQMYGKVEWTLGIGKLKWNKKFKNKIIVLKQNCFAHN